MLHRERDRAPADVYPPDEWRIVEKRFYPRLHAQAESIFALSNGYLGLRGTFDEGEPVHDRGNFVNGFHETWPIVYGEEAFGFAQTGQTMVEVPDGKIIKLFVDDEPFSLLTADLVRFERLLDMRAGVLDREVLWETPAGKRVSIRSRRIVSLANRHLAGIAYEVTVLNAEAPVVISSELALRHRQREAGNDPRQARRFEHSVLLPQLCRAGDRRVVLCHATRNSDMRLACAMDHVIETECAHSVEVKHSDDSGKVVLSVDAKPGETVRFFKFLSYHCSSTSEPRELAEYAERTLDRAVARGFADLEQTQRRVVDDFWRRSDVRLEGAPTKQQALRFNLFQILQATARAEGVGVPAKGLTGHGYEGHYFWDTEIYVLPFLIYTSPRIARNLLRFRLGLLDKARERAREVGEKGALFPWRTINGEEASAYYAAGTAQYHINADIVYTLRKYTQVTGDETLLMKEGAEVLVETARLWRSLGFFSESEGQCFHIHGVTGPDEYATVVNNNTFTNLMARENLWYAAEVTQRLRDKHPERFSLLVDQTGLDVAEIAEWKQAADRMYLPYDEKLGVHPQDDSFLKREVWDFENTPPEKYPLLLHFHPLVIYRHQVIKQADMVLAMFLLGDEFSLEEKKRNFDYYDPLTTGDSSLSVCIQSIVAAEIGYSEKMRDYSEYALMMDLGDIQGNVEDGLHIASMGGTWMVVANGLAGMRDYGGQISFSPRAPGPAVTGLRIPLTIRGCTLEVEIGREVVTYRLLEGENFSFRHEDEEIRLTREDSEVVRPISPEKKLKA